jgi:hypothetical protein
MSTSPAPFTSEFVFLGEFTIEHFKHKESIIALKKTITCTDITIPSYRLYDVAIFVRDDMKGSEFIKKYEVGDVVDSDALRGLEEYADLSSTTPLTAELIALLKEDEFVFKTYSENEGLVEEMERLGLVKRTGKVYTVGYAGPQPIVTICKTPGVFA